VGKKVFFSILQKHSQQRNTIDKFIFELKQSHILHNNNKTNINKYLFLKIKKIFAVD
jgi:hypothetical protein